MTYTYEKIDDPNADAGFHFRVRDRDDNRVATCWTEENAFKVTEALNYYHGQPVLWSCSHTASGHCAECYRLLAAKAHELAEALDDKT